MWIVTLLRVVSAATVFIHPLYGFIFYCLLDLADWHILKRLGYSFERYERWDKYADMPVLVPQFYLLSDSPYVGIVWILFLWRMMGIVWFLRTNNRLVFLRTPNIFEVWFVWEVLFGAQNYVILVALIIFKLMQEGTIHYLWNTKK